MVTLNTLRNKGGVLLAIVIGVALLAFVLGVVPLILATGAGAAARHSMGTGVFGGMLAATFISTIFVPVFFTWFASRTKRKR